MTLSLLQIYENCHTQKRPLKDWLKFLETNHASILETIRNTKELSKELDTQLTSLSREFADNFLSKL